MVVDKCEIYKQEQKALNINGRQTEFINDSKSKM